MSGSPPAKRRKRGGIRQRLASDAADDEFAPITSKLVRDSLKDFAWGTISAQKVQKNAENALRDLRKFKEQSLSSRDDSNSLIPLRESVHPIETELDRVATIGVSGQYSNKCYSDLMARIEPNMFLPLPHRTKMRFRPPMGEQVQEMLLPHEMFAALFKNKTTWKKVIVPNNDLPLKFWTCQRDAKHPQWIGHPLEAYADEDLRFVVPISLHGDEVPITGIGKQWSRKMVNFSWHSLISCTASVQDSQFFIWSLFDKAGINETGDAGYKTLDNFFEILRWSFEFLFQGIFPTHDALGRASLR